MKPEVVGDETEWRAALGGDAAPFARLFDRHRDAAYRQALRIADRPADAEEAAAAAFFELWRRRESVPLVAGSVLPWLLVTTANLARNTRRARVRQEALLQRLPRDRDDEASRREFDRIDDGLIRHDLVRALRRLRPVDAALVTITALDGYRVEEVAPLLGLTGGAARVRLHRARKRLQADLAPLANRIDRSEEPSS